MGPCLRYAPRAMMNAARFILPLLFLACAPLVQAVDVVLSGGVALKSWEHLRGPVAHDNWWANFIRGATVHMDKELQKRPGTRFTWIVYRPAYLARGKEDGKDYISLIREQAAKRRAKLVFVDSADQAYRAINRAGRRKPIRSFCYFGHSNAHAFMLDYSNDIIGASTQIIHEKELGKKLKPGIFAKDASCWSYGCYTGLSMSQVWMKSIGVPLWGNTESTRYQPVGWGELPTGNGEWKR